MARRNRDIAGLLTGIPSGGYASRMADLSREMGTMFGSGITGMMTGDVRTPTQQLTGDIKNFVNLTDERKQAVISGLQARGQTGVANQLLAGEQQRVNKAKLTKDELLVANSLPPEYSQLAEAIKKGVKGALAKGVEVLGRKRPEVKPTKGEKPTATDIKSAKKALSLAGEEAKGGEAFGFLGTDWNDAWNNQTEAAQDLLAEQVAEVTNKLIDGGMDLSQARKLAIKKMYTDNLTETGLFEWDKGESRMLTADEIEEKQKKDLEARLAKPDYQ